MRWRPGAGGPALGLPLDALLDATVPLEELWGADAADALAERLAAAPAAADRAELLQDVVAGRSRAAGPPDPLVVAACRAVAAGARDGRPPAVGQLAAALGVSERQLLRRFRAAVGYGPRTLARVLRFQRFLAAAWGPPAGSALAAPARAPEHDLAALAAEAGYADQSHLTRACRQLAGTTPGALLAGD